MTSVTSETTPTCIAGIQTSMSTINWDNPKHVLLSLAAAVETHMGGTSGAVSYSTRLLYLDQFKSTLSASIEYIISMLK